MKHASDCSMHNAPAVPAGPCDCTELTKGEVDRAAFWIDHLLTLIKPDGDSISFDAHALASFLVAIERGGRQLAEHDICPPRAWELPHDGTLTDKDDDELPV